ncbi:MAG: lytic transglycosylase domain-containing protein [Burkholderiaceae bacterium]|nr:lytic transglycosylase domain-containing protein [Burkholderiaceae bacterium]
MKFGPKIGANIHALPAWILVSLLLFLQQPAFADVWGFIDDKGVAHFAAERTDARYELFFRGGESFDTQQSLAGRANGPVSKVQAAANSKIHAYFDVSPSYKQVKHHMREASKVNSVDFELLQALIVAESGFDAQAVSPKGAVGLMQLMPATAQRFGVRADKAKSVEQKLTDPKTNIGAGTRYLRALMQMFPGKLELAIAAYNAGEGAVQRAGNQIPNYKETQNYVKTVMQTYRALKPPASLAELRNGAPSRVRMEMDGAIGGATERGNMIAPFHPSNPSGSARVGTPVTSLTLPNTPIGELTTQFN